ncbi:hypothetical protein DPMN_143854 [Dreissena polymorpha]|uniref:Uncharacterized protein n=1 Tax=Dreissena polymorpha TaxID=45954 RepID=A0A9D4JPP6_DREPO|nr:hypothetical protein DPMN_143854 [Dreissena polymorpha]
MAVAAVAGEHKSSRNDSAMTLPKESCSYVNGVFNSALTVDDCVNVIGASLSYSRTSALGLVPEFPERAAWYSCNTNSFNFHRLLYLLKRRHKS